MKQPATATSAARSIKSLCVAACLLFATLPAFSQARLQLSSSSDFSSISHVFTDGETIFIRVQPRVGLDFSAVTESKFEVKPVGDGEDFEGTLALQDDSTFTGSVEVSSLVGNSVAWLVKVEIEDDFDREFEARTAIALRGRSEHPSTFRVSGTVEAATSGEITVDGRVILITEDTEIDGRADTAEELLGKEVVVVVQQNSDGTLTALRVVLHGDRDDDDEDDGDDDDEGEDDDDENDDDDDDDERDQEIVIRGEIVAVGPDSSITIGSTSFFVTGDTRISGEHGSDPEFADVAVGMFARAHLLMNADSTWTAFRLRIEERFEDEDVKITGRIEAVSGTEITVHGTTFIVTDDTEVEGHHDEDIAISDLRAGMIVRIEGERDEDGDLIASEITVRGRVHHEGRISGLVTSTDDDTLEVNGVAIAINEETIFRGAATLDEIAVGKRVQVHYRQLSDGTLLALRVRVHSHSDDEAEITGVIESIDGETVVVAGATVHVNALTVILDSDNEAIALADLEVGQTVEVEGIAVGDDIVALKIKVEDSVVISGVVVARDGSGVSVGGGLFAVSDETLIIGPSNAELTISDLSRGAFVEILAAGKIGAGKSMGTTMQAERILVFDASTATAAGDDGSLPSSIALLQNYPNPFNPSTTISFEINRPDGGNVTLAVYNMLGQKVRTLVDGALAAGAYSFAWNGRDDAGNALSSGVYLYRLHVAGQTATRAMTLTK